MITKKLLREWSACWESSRVDSYFGKRTELTPREILADKTIFLDDRLWVAAKCLWYLDESAARWFAIESALTVAHRAGDEDDQATFLGLMNHLGEIEDLPLRDRDAARDAARAAVWDAARAAVWDAVWDAARAAVWDAARAAARAAVWDAARAAALQKSLDRALEWLGDFADGWEES